MPVGRVCPHFRSRLLDESGSDAAPNSDGELCLAGPGVTAGYWNAPEETARAFFIDAHGEQWYRTGDILRADKDGLLVYRGRRDRMIKRRGNRVELAEIETCLYQFTHIKDVAAVAIPDAERELRIDVFVVTKDSERPTIIELKAHCATLLPRYMVPDGFLFCNDLPRTATGKVDFAVLRQTATQMGKSTGCLVTNDN